MGGWRGTIENKTKIHPKPKGKGFLFGNFMKIEHTIPLGEGVALNDNKYLLIYSGQISNKAIFTVAIHINEIIMSYPVYTDIDTTFKIGNETITVIAYYNNLAKIVIIDNGVV